MGDHLSASKISETTPFSMGRAYGPLPSGPGPVPSNAPCWNTRSTCDARSSSTRTRMRSGGSWPMPPDRPSGFREWFCPAWMGRSVPSRPLSEGSSSRRSWTSTTTPAALGTGSPERCTWSTTGDGSRFWMIPTGHASSTDRRWSPSRPPTSWTQPSVAHWTASGTWCWMVAPPGEAGEPSGARGACLI